MLQDFYGLIGEQKIKVLVACNLFFNSIQMTIWVNGVLCLEKSTLDQRIEARWGALKKLGIHWWINLFKDILDTGMFDVFLIDVLQTDLNRIAKHRNYHEIQPQRGYTELPSWKPDVLYFVPVLTDGPDFKTPVNAENVNVCINLYGKKKVVAKSSKNLWA